MTLEKADDEYLISMQVICEKPEDLAKCLEVLSRQAAGFLLDGVLRASVSIQKLEVFEEMDDGTDHS